jgi:hypothetical protein
VQDMQKFGGNDEREPTAGAKLAAFIVNLMR